MRQTVNPHMTDTIRPVPGRTRSNLTLSIALAAFVLWAALAPAAKAQGSRKDDIVLGTTGHPVAGATVRVCQSTATGTPCTPLATIYTTAAMTVTAANPFQADGLGNYHFYAPAGRYMIQLTGPGITGTVTQPDVILAPDVSSTGSGNNISAFGLNLGGNLTVAGNATISGTLTSGTFSPGTFAPNSLQVNGNSCQAGPRPYIDVTCPAFGAKGDSQTDDTAAISAALTAACATTTTLNGLAMHPAVVFPPGVYRVQQPQTPSAAAPLSVPCGFIELRGFPGGSAASGSQPASQITVTPGSSPNAAPLIMVTNVGTVRFTNLSIQGYNQGVWVRSALGNIVFDNSPLAANGTTGMADNTALKISNTILVWRINHSSAQVSGSATTPPVIYAAESPVFSEGPIVGIIYTRDVSDAGGAEQVICRVSGCVMGNYHFNDIENEDSNNGFITFTNTSGVAAIDYAIFTFDNVTVSDSTVAAPFLNFNDSLSILTGVRMNYVLGSNIVAIQVTAGHLIGYDVQGECHTQGVCSWAVQDGNGNAIATGRSTEQFGAVDHTSDASFEIASPTAGLFNGMPSIADRWCASGGVYCSLGIDPTFGILFGLGDSNSFNAGLKQTSAETLDVQFANFLPPMAFSGSATTGGTLAAGTYFAQIWTTANNDCATTFSAPTYAAGVVVGGSNNAVNFSWTNPIATPGSASISGHCLSIQTTPIAVSSNTGQHLFVAGAGATSFLYTGQAQAAGAPSPSNQMVSEHRFTSNSLGVNTTNPQFNLDVNGSAAVNSLNGVQKAERFSGADAAAKINACLAAASTGDGVCDARGLTGSLTATSHIAIPAGTTLLWGQAQLTINDSTTKDAVELMGDGSALLGYQESGTGTVARPDTSGFIACGIAGCTTVDNPNSATRNVDWIHIAGMSLVANGSGSKVINLSSVAHARIQDNQLTVGTGGSSFGIFGDTSTGAQDSTNDIIQHNEINLESQNDVCVRLAGIFNINVLEINVCYIAAGSTGQEGFIYAKDSNANYPNNSLVYGNDAEQGGSSISFGVIGYDIQGATDVTISNNRCEHIYACIKLPADGSALGIHLIDNYFSISNQIQLLPNEPATAETAMENNGHNWAPSYHFGINDLAGRNLLGNAAFEGWANSTTLYYWGGVSGTNINQAGSGIYAQNTSAGTPADATTQGAFNVKIGDNATAGLGINSACIQLDSTMNYTLAFRIASTSTSVNFRPGFRFYSDPNCTEANKITNIATNARILTPANYAGQSALIGAGTNPNWQSTNASLTYNNGITCNCNVTGADWNVAATNTWTPTRNFAVTFRVPNAFSSTTTVAQSMRVFILENTAANPNQIFVDDVILSEGPVNPRVPLTAPLADSGNPTEYGNLTVSGTLTAGPSALPATLTNGTPVAANCAAFTSGTTTNVQDSGSPCPTLFTRFTMGIASAGQAPSAANAVDVSVVYLPNIQFSKLTVDVSTTDASTSDFYSWAITDPSGNVKCSITAVNVTAGGASDQSCTQGTVTLAAGAYLFAFTGNATVGKIAYSGTAPLALSSAVSSSTSASGAMTFPISVPAAGVTYSGYGLPAIILH